MDVVCLNIVLVQLSYSDIVYQVMIVVLVDVEKVVINLLFYYDVFNVIVFCLCCDVVNKFVVWLINCGFFVVVLLGEFSQKECSNLVFVMCDGCVCVCVVIDVVVCGLDVVCIIYVINYDVFYDIEVYIYWVGCIGCVGCIGKVILLVILCEWSWLKILEWVINLLMEVYELFLLVELKKMCEQQFEIQLMGFVEDKKLVKVMLLLDEIVECNDMDMVMVVGVLVCWMEVV